MTAVLLLLIQLLVSAQVTQVASGNSPQLRFVAQLSVSGCVLFVHDTGASDGPHLAVEPIMCVTERLDNIAPRYDLVTQQTYVSVPVMLRDEAMLAEVQRKLRHLSPKSVKFATVSDISVSTDSSSRIQALGFDWSSDEPTGNLRLGCSDNDGKAPIKDCLVRILISYLKNSSYDIVGQVSLSTALSSNGSIQQHKYSLTLQNRSMNYLEFWSRMIPDLPKCQKLRFVRSIRLINCTARVYQRLDMIGHFLIEPLLCHNITNMSNESIMYDYSRDKYYMTLDIVLQDDMAVDAVRTQLADLSPRSVAFMRLLRAQRHVASALSRRFVIGPLMVSGDFRSAQLRVYCRNEYECVILREDAHANPITLWRQIRWRVTSLIDTNNCAHESEFLEYVSSFTTRESNQTLVPLFFNLTTDQIDLCHARFYKIDVPLSKYCIFSEQPDGGGMYIVIQQQLNGAMSFQRNWTEYERGFGDDTNFWIGLTTIHSLSNNEDGATLRVEMKLLDGTELHLVYDGFKVGNASTNYTMTYREMLRDRSSTIISEDGMAHSKGMQFSTMDRDNDKWSRSCSKEHGNAGWWFHGCTNSHPNGLCTGRGKRDYDWTRGYCFWWLDNFRLGARAPLREVRLMLL